MKYTDDGKELGASKIATIMLGWCENAGAIIPH